MPTLKSEKVILRVIKKEDIESMIEWFNDSEVIQYLQHYLPMTRLAEEKWLEKVSLSEKDVVFIIEAVTNEGSKSIGITGLHGIHAKDHNATFGIAIGDKNFWGGGYGTVAARLIIRYGFEQLNLHRIDSSVIDFNKRSYKMHLKIGFQIEGKRRQAMFKNNRYWDLLILGLLKKEFV